MFVIRRKTDGKYLKGGRGGYYNPIQWVDDINNARTYSRKCDASNSIVGHFSGYYTKRQNVEKKDLETVEARLSLATDSGPELVRISPEVLDRATRFMMTEEAEKNGAPASLIDSFEDLDTTSLVKIVTTLYSGK